jgi:hypothetical protein
MKSAPFWRQDALAKLPGKRGFFGKHFDTTLMLRAGLKVVAIFRRGNISRATDGTIDV